MVCSILAACSTAVAAAEVTSHSKIIDIIQKHPACGQSKTGSSSSLEAVKGYYHGMILTYARAVCRKSSDVVKKKMLNGKNNRSDALFLFGLDSNPTEDDKVLTKMMTVALAHGLRESNGNFKQGFDATVKNPTSDTAEAGLFQISMSVKGADAAWRTLLKS